MCDCWYKEVCEGYGENCQTLCVRYAEMKYLMEHSNLPVAKRQPQNLSVQEVDYIPYLRLDTIRNVRTFILPVIIWATGRQAGRLNLC